VVSAEASAGALAFEAHEVVEVMQYEEALKIWGASKLISPWTPLRQYESVDVSTVRVVMTFNEGYACCGGTDPDCYCSLAESPRASVEITGETDLGRKLSYDMDASDFNFTEVLGEILCAGDGTLSL
jgi:hypothetical protein